MKISILTPDLSHNCLGRAYLLAKILQRHYEVEVIGPLFGAGIWKPVADDKSITYKSVRLRGRVKPYWDIRELYNKIDGDVIYASKPLFTSFVLGLLKRRLSKKPLVLDIDDWEMGFIKEGITNLSLIPYLMKLTSSALFIYRMNSYWNNSLCEKLFNYADDITISNSFLKNIFGGTIVCHGRDTTMLDPEKFNANKIKEKFNITKDQKVVMFLGTPRPHKGLEDLVKSLQLVNDKKIILIIVGLDNSPYSNMLNNFTKKTLPENFRGFGLQSFEKVPEFLSMADIVVIPQKRNLATIGQIPAKVFDAMAMGKTIIATNVSDLPDILNGCGWIVEPGNHTQLAKSIQFALANQEQGKKMGINARQKCIKKYSWNAMERTLLNVFRKYE